jgi:hypothetical protein
MERFNRVGSVFRIGNPETTYDLVEDKLRLLVWTPAAFDTQLALAAGWQNKVKQGHSGPNQRTIQIPLGTRSAENVLGGVEAWPNEKLDFIEFIGNYSRAVHELTGKTDVSVGLRTVARTNDGDFFITPPHTLTSNPDEINEWRTTLAASIETVLLAEESPQTARDLAQYFIDITLDPPTGVS